MTEKLLNGGTATLLVRAFWVALFAIGGYFISRNDKHLEALDTRTDYIMRESAAKEARLTERLARLEERLKMIKRRNDLDE